MFRRIWIPKGVARRPIAKTKSYLKYGFVITECEVYHCPKCGGVLNAGPGYQPRHCSQCGQRVSFDGVGWKQERTLGFFGGEVHE